MELVEHLQPSSPASFLERWPVEGIKHGVNVSSCFNLSRSTIFSDVWLIKPEGSYNPLFKAVLYSMSWGRKLVNTCTAKCFTLGRPTVS